MTANTKKHIDGQMEQKITNTQQQTCYITTAVSTEACGRQPRHDWSY